MRTHPPEDSKTSPRRVCPHLVAEGSKVLGEDGRDLRPLPWQQLRSLVGKHIAPGKNAEGVVKKSSLSGATTPLSTRRDLNPVILLGGRDTSS